MNIQKITSLQELDKFKEENPEYNYFISNPFRKYFILFDKEFYPMQDCYLINSDKEKVPIADIMLNKDIKCVNVKIADV